MIRGILTTLTDGLVRLFSASGRPGESFSAREFIQHYGYASAPLPGAELVIHAQGNMITCIASDDRRYRIALENGEVALYDDLGQKAHLTRSGIQVTSPLKITATAPEVDIIASSQVNITTPVVHISNDVTIGGKLDVTDNIASLSNITAVGNISDAGGTKSMSGMRTVYDAHTHPEHGTGGGTTSQPNQGM